MGNYHERIVRHARYQEGQTSYYVELTADTVADMPNPAEHPEWEVGSELVVLENGGSKYRLSNARAWVKVNFDDLAEGGDGGSDSGAARLDSMINRSIADVQSNAEMIGRYAFYGCANLASIDFPSATTIDGQAFQGCTNLVTVSFPLVTSIGSSAFYGCTNLASADFPLVTSIGTSAFQYCSNLNALILRNATLCTLSAKNAFTGTPIESGTGYIYVPAALVDTYKSATNWSALASQFRALEDYTTDGTAAGALDPSKI